MTVRCFCGRASRRGSQGSSPSSVALSEQIKQAKKQGGGEDLSSIHLPLCASRRLRERMLLLSSPFAVSPAPLLRAASSSPLQPVVRLRIEAAKQMTGRVVTTKADKTVGVEVVRLAPHPKYKRRERIKKKYQAHDPENQFKVGDMVELRSSRPISKTKHFVAIPLPPRDTRRKSQLLPPLQSQADADSSSTVAE